MHANFILHLFPSSSDHHQNFIRRCYHRLRRFFRGMCFCCVLGIWSLSFTSTVPLLYTIDSNEKSPKPVYCPGTKDMTYLEEWFDQNRLIQTILFNLIPLVICICLSAIALLKLFSDYLIYLFNRCRRFRWIPCDKTQVDSSLPSCRQCFISSFLRFLLILSCCLLACIYPIVMRFYVIYFSVFVPLIFGALNFSRTNTTMTTAVVENQTIEDNPVILNRTFQNTEIINRPVDLPPPIMMNLLNRQNLPPSPAPSSTSTALSTPRGIHRRQKYPLYQRNSFANHFYENLRNIYTK